jgi:hypothetical protein
MSADGWQFVPEIGRNADLDTQIRCAPVQPDLDVYAECIRWARVMTTPIPALTLRSRGRARNQGPKLSHQKLKPRWRRVITPCPSDRANSQLKSPNQHR